MSKSLKILQLYPKDMNIYGDWGNVLTLKQRANWHGYTTDIIDYNVGDVFPRDVDIIVGGGGQDSGQTVITNDLLSLSPLLHTLAGQGTPMLVICGMYQLFGKFFKTREGVMLNGIGILDVETHGGEQRLIGNVVVESKEFGTIVGYENHSGQTFLASGMTPLGSLQRGAGNNGHDTTEGARYKNIVASYLHGSLLPKNPRLADWLIEKAAINKYGEFEPSVINDSFADQARLVAIKRPR